jgi:hypothetical protein
MRFVKCLGVGVLLLSVPAFGQFKLDVSGDSVPGEVPAAIASSLGSTGVKVSNGNVGYCELWFVKSLPTGAAGNEQDVTLPTIPVGAVLGVIRFDGKSADRRGQGIAAGLYVLRYVQMPVNGAHVGAAPQRDFAAMVPVAVEKGGNPNLEETIAMSTKATGTAHPGVLSLAPGSGQVTLTKEGDHDWTLNTKIGDVAISIIVSGKSEG